MRLIAAATMAALTLIPANAESWAENRSRELRIHWRAGLELHDAGHYLAACNSFRHAELIINQSYSTLKNHTPEFDFSELLTEFKNYTSAC